MAKQVYQFRYYGDGDSRNQPAGTITGSKLKSGSIFAKYLPMYQIGIQTMPGVKFYVNNGTLPIIIGQTGIYEIDVDGLTEITNLTFDTTAINLIKANPSNAYLIIDIIYDDGEA